MATGRSVLLNGINLGIYTVDTFNSSTLPEGGQLGQIYESDAKFYRLVLQNDATVATAAGSAAYWVSKAAFTVATDVSDGEALGNGVAGGYLGVVTNGNYCFIQMGGDQSVGVNATTAISDQFSGGLDSTLTVTAAGTACVNKLVAVALSVDTTGFATLRWEFMKLI